MNITPQDLCLSPESTLEPDSTQRFCFPLGIRLFPLNLMHFTRKHMPKFFQFSAGPPPRFPIEIIQLIIHEAWALPLTTSERVQFTKSSFLVSLSWMHLFARESCVHVHLLSGEHTKYWYKPITSGSPSVYSTIAGVDGPAVRRLCRTITFHCIDPRDVLQPRGATHPTHPICTTTNLISGIVRGGGFDNFEGFVTMQLPHTVNNQLKNLEQDTEWFSSHDTYKISITSQFWQVEIASGIAELYNVLEKLVLWVMQSRWNRVRLSTISTSKEGIILDTQCGWAWFFIRYNGDGGKGSGGSLTFLNAGDYNIGVEIGSYPPLNVSSANSDGLSNHILSRTDIQELILLSEKDLGDYDTEIVHLNWDKAVVGCMASSTRVVTVTSFKATIIQQRLIGNEMTSSS
ncbi:hypothetical protein BT96DRAFT_1027140 [Gymnopus androsaceus JB14]|uniref:Uncharacterized protein n=1 Tax=Gymnopus androsaceus JB14 TaxID=1447944 RepID=A0A6A4GDZ8_9AGAR|nr:hypothetical protein BT96DRAFT_1027140 [Gymnopus androsaceus JB14]